MEYALGEKQMEARRRSCLALDVPTVGAALQLAEELAPFFGSMKVGKELHTAAGNAGVDIVGELHGSGTSAFLDLKLHDTPNTVYSAALKCAVPGVYMFNLHIASNELACRKAVEASHESAAKYGVERPKVIGVTVLTSMDDENLRAVGIDMPYDDLVRLRTQRAVEWGLDGVVCPASKAGGLEKEFGSGLTYVTPGVKWKGKQGEGQKQLYTPDRAVKDCSSSILVIGSAVTKADDKKATAFEILEAMALYL